MEYKAKVQCNQSKLFVYRLMTFGEWLRDQINAKNTSNAVVARKAGVSATYIGNLIRDFSPNTKSGKGKPSEEVAESIGRALGVPIDDARIAAGYSPKDISATHDILEKARVSFLDGSFTPEEQERILDMMRTLVAGAIAGKGKTND